MDKVYLVWLEEKYEHSVLLRIYTDYDTAVKSVEDYHGKIGIHDSYAPENYELIIDPYSWITIESFELNITNGVEILYGMGSDIGKEAITKERDFSLKLNMTCSLPTIL